MEEVETILLLILPVLITLCFGISLAFSSRRPFTAVGLVLSLSLILAGSLLSTIDSDETEKEADFGQQIKINTTVIPHDAKIMEISMNEPKRRVWNAEDDEYEEKDIKDYQKYTTFIVNNTVNTFIFNTTDFILSESMIISDGYLKPTSRNLTITTIFKGEPFYSYVISQPKIIEYGSYTLSKIMIFSGIAIFVTILSLFLVDIYLEMTRRKERRRIARSTQEPSIEDLVKERERLLEEGSEEFHENQKKEKEKLRKEQERKKKYRITKYGDIPKVVNDYFLIELFDLENALEECQRRRKGGQWCKIKNYGTTKQTEEGEPCCAVYVSKWNEYEQEERGKPKWKK